MKGVGEINKEKIKGKIEKQYRDAWNRSEAAERDTDNLGESYLIGVMDGNLEAIEEIYTMLYGYEAMMELWKSVYLKEDKDD